jgi:hypothetical protein
VPLLLVLGALGAQAWKHRQRTVGRMADRSAK